MQEPFVSLPSAPSIDTIRQGIPDVRAVGSSEGICDLSIVSITSGDASVTSEVLHSSSAANIAEQHQQQQQHIPAIEPHNPFFDNTTSLIGNSATTPVGPAPANLGPEVIAPLPASTTSLGSDASPYNNNRGIVNSPASGSNNNVTNRSAHQIAGQPSITSSDAEEDDEDTAPSSTGRGPLTLPTETFYRLIENTKRFLQRKDSEEDDDSRPGLLIAGYLQKLGRNGKWQTRWFETDGECLSYYKNQKRSKLLATLELQKVRCYQQLLCPSLLL
jgi:PH domain